MEHSPEIVTLLKEKTSSKYKYGIVITVILLLCISLFMLFLSNRKSDNTVHHVNFYLITSHSYEFTLDSIYEKNITQDSLARNNIYGYYLLISSNSHNNQKNRYLIIDRTGEPYISDLKGINEIPLWCEFTCDAEYLASIRHSKTMTLTTEDGEIILKIIGTKKLSHTEVRVIAKPQIDMAKATCIYFPYRISSASLRPIIEGK